jgi:hypothetical protein
LPADHRCDADRADDEERGRDVGRTAQGIHANRPAFRKEKAVDSGIISLPECKRSPS